MDPARMRELLSRLSCPLCGGMRDDSLLVAVAHDPEHLRRLRELGLVSAIAVPLTARGQVLGVLTLVAAESGRRYGVDDLQRFTATVAFDTVQIKADHHTVRARVATPEEKPTLWRIMTATGTPYDEFQAKANREIPVVVLEPR